MNHYPYQSFNPRKVEIAKPGSNPTFNKNSLAYINEFKSLGEFEAPTPKRERFWAQEDLDQIVATCNYVSDNLPPQAFSLDKIPGLQIFAENYGIAIGANDPEVGSYMAIRPHPDGLMTVHALTDREAESSGGTIQFRSITDAVNHIFLGWLMQVGGVRNPPIFTPDFCVEEASVAEYKWDTYRGLLTSEQQAHREAYAQRLANFLNSPGKRSSNVEDLLNRPPCIYQSQERADRWYIAGDSPYYRNLSYGLSVDSITFLDRVVAAIAAQKGAP